MRCPICKEELVVTGQDRLQTLDEHVCRPNDTPSLKDKYECLNDYCPAKDNIMWNSHGELYTQNGCRYTRYIQFIDDNDAPFGSYQRQLNVEIYKKDENHPLFGKEFKWGYIEVKYLYTSNEDGDILSRKRSYEVWLKNKDSLGYTLYQSGIGMLVYCIKRFHLSLKRGWNDIDLYAPSHDKRWWKRLSCWYARTYMKIFHRAQFKELTS